MKNFLIGALLSCVASMALAEVSIQKVENELREYFDRYPLQEVIGTRSSDDASTAYIRVLNTTDGKTINGSASFIRMDSGQWFLTNAYLATGGMGGTRWNYIFKEVDID